MDQNTQPNPAPSQPGVQPDYSQPVAYDNQGNPLYARPPQPAASQPQAVYATQAAGPPRQPVAPDVLERAAASRKQYPQLNLSEGEYVITEVSRHPIGILQVWGGLFLVALALIGLFALFVANRDNTMVAGLDANTLEVGGVAVIGLILLIMASGGLVSTYVYKSNRFFLTNESIIQHVQTSLFSKDEQTVGLESVEDVSYQQNGFLQMMLNYGSIRLSTIGEDTIYRFSYVSNPKKQIAVLKDAIEKFKNYRLAR